MRAYEAAKTELTAGDAAPAMPRRSRPTHTRWVDGERWYVDGETGPDGERVWLSMIEVGVKLGVSPGRVSQYAAQHSWRKKRDAKWDIDIDAHIRSRTARPHVAPKSVTGVTPRTVGTSDGERILLIYLAQCEAAILAGRVKCDNMSDVDKALRALAFVRGEADSRREVHTTVSLDVLQSRHHEARARAERLAPDEVTGVLPDVEPHLLDAHGEAVDERSGEPQEAVSVADTDTTGQLTVETDEQSRHNRHCANHCTTPSLDSAILRDS